MNLAQANLFSDFTLTDMGFDTPDWFEDLTIVDVLDIAQYGVASGLYMPCVEYVTAMRVMAEYGEDIVKYLDNRGCDLEFTLRVEQDTFGGFCSQVWSLSIELWCCDVADTLASASAEDYIHLLE